VVAVGVGEGVGAGVRDGVAVPVDLGVSLGVSVGIPVDVDVAVSTGVRVGVPVGTGIGVVVGVDVFVLARVSVGVHVGLGVAVSVGVGVGVGAATVVARLAIVAQPMASAVALTLGFWESMRTTIIETISAMATRMSWKVPRLMKLIIPSSSMADKPVRVTVSSHPSHGGRQFGARGVSFRSGETLTRI
jgi:hypothetical protein